MSDLREQASWDSSESSALDRAANTSATHGAYLDDLASVPYGKDATAFNMSEQGGCTHRAQAAAEPAQLVKRQSCVPGDITAAFGEIARQPTQYYIAVTVARVTYALCLALVWVVGWLFSDIYWPCVVPPAVNAMCVLIEVASVHTQGPMRHATSLFGRIALLLTIATFTFVTTLPIFLATPKKPFSHHYVQTAASCVLAFAGCIFVQTPIILIVRKFGVVATQHTFWGVLAQALLRTCTFVDCWTDCEVSVLLWHRVRCEPIYKYMSMRCMDNQVSIPGMHYRPTSVLRVNPPSQEAHSAAPRAWISSIICVINL